jgi:hypothetical protein
VVMKPNAATMGQFHFYQCTFTAGVVICLKKNNSIFLNGVVNFSFHVTKYTEIIYMDFRN